MKTVLKKIVVMLVLCMSLASSLGFVSADAATKMTKTVKKAMNKAYKKKLKKLFNSYKKDEYITEFAMWYSYSDIDGDGIDEMITMKAFASGFDSTAYIMKIYKYIDGKIIDMTKKVEIYLTTFDFANNYDYIFTEFQGDSLEVDIYKRSGNYYKKVAFYFDGEETVFELYDKKTKGLKEVPEADFWAYCDKNLKKSVEEELEWTEYGYWPAE